MPINKQDIQQFGETLKDTLSVWGEQIQYGRDVEKLKKIQKGLVDVSSVTMGKDGKMLSAEQIGKNLLNFNTQLSEIRTPEILKLASTNVASYFNTAFKGATMQAENDAQLQGMQVTQPTLYKEYNKIKSEGNLQPFEQSLAKGNYSNWKGPKMFAPKGFWRQSADNPDMMEYVMPSYYTDGSFGGLDVLGTTPRTELSTPEQIALKERGFETQLEVARTPNININSSSVTSRSEGPQAFYDPINKKQVNTIYKGGSYYDADTKKPINVQGLQQIGENLAMKDQPSMIDIQAKVVENLKGIVSNAGWQSMELSRQDRDLFNNPYWYNLSPEIRDFLLKTVYIGYRDKQQDVQK